ncbi:nuclear transport factor 2 family protein [Levilactobacillus sp. HBUAS70063]|uniref:nuclear transport factor 2 family protein n=1 Tax=Levilactobacillus sp. HBUAS70063 TaxID=3109359 RepID=UPI00313338AC
MSQAAKTLENFLNAISKMDIKSVQDMFANNVTQFVPFAPAGTPDKIEGKEAVASTFGSLPQMFKNMDYSNVEIVETNDDNFAIGFAHADATLVNDTPYDQNYVFYVRTNNDGLISEYREYMNPVKLGEAIAQLTK